MSDTRAAALSLAEEILGNIELADISLSAVILKSARLARLIGDEESRQIFSYEAGGYPSTPEGVTNDVFELGRKAGRVYKEKDKEGNTIERMNIMSIDSIENQIEASKISLSSAIDRPISISSSNPNQMVIPPAGNKLERDRHNKSILDKSKITATSKAYAYNYASNVQFELQFAEAVSEIFERTTEKVDLDLLAVAPQAAQKTASIRKNLLSENPEDWANAVHSCRRLLQDIADALFPAQEPRERSGKTIKLSVDNYINRLMAYIEDNSDSERFQEIVGSTLSYIGERLDAVFKAAQKGSHSSISSRDEAERYVIYTYLTVGDILALDKR